MKWTNNWAKKNGIRFELAYGATLDGKEQENKWHLRISRPEGRDIYKGCIHTERFLRFGTKEAAMEFCERVAAGEVSLDALKASETKAYEAYFAQKRAKNDEKVDVFFAKMQELGVNPVVVPEVLKAYGELNNSLDGSILSVFRDRLAELEKQQAAPVPAHKQTMEEYLKTYGGTFDVCVRDRDTGEHYLSAISELTPEDLAAGLDYDDRDKWILSLPFDHVQDIDGNPTAIVNSDFSWDQASFLLDEVNNFDSEEWFVYSCRASWANASFADRLAFLTDNKPFEKPFDGLSMDVVYPEDRQQLITMMSYSPVYVCQDAEDPDPEKLHAYSYRMTSTGNIGGYQRVPIRETEPGEGLISSLDGKIAWIRYVGMQSSLQEEKEPEKTGVKENDSHDR